MNFKVCRALVISIVSVLMLLLICALCIDTANSEPKEKGTVETYLSNAEKYELAKEQMKSGDLEAAKKTFFSMDDIDYKDTVPLICLCGSAIAYQKNELKEAYSLSRELTFEHLTKEELEKVENYLDLVEHDYDTIWYVNYKAQVDKEMPFVGMKEEEIYTVCGDEYYIQKSYKSKRIGSDWKTVTVYKYQAHIAYNTYIIAYCRNGEVIEVEDHRKNPIPYKYGSKGNADYDPYGARSYSNAEDFYDDHYDDFFDYEEAEDYFNEYNP